MTAAAARRQERQPARDRAARPASAACARTMTRVRQVAAQPAEQRLQVHRARARSRLAVRATAAAPDEAPGPSRSPIPGIGMSAGADGQAVPGVQPGGQLDHAQIRRHRARPRDQPAALPADGRRHHGRERAGRRHAPSPSACRAAAPQATAAAAGGGPPPPTPPDAAPRRRRGRDGKVLVIDDEQTVRDLMRRFLAREGFDVVTAKDGAEGLALARQLHPALITLDVLMPGFDGWSVLQALEGRSGARPDPGRDADHPRREEQGLRARRLRLPDQAVRPRPPARRCSPSYGRAGARARL